MILDTLTAEARRRVAQAKAKRPETKLAERLPDARATLDMAQVLRRPGVSLIAEVKRASPSRGALNAELEPRQTARLYATHGADAISVLTEPSRFRGSLDDLQQVRAELDAAAARCPVLRKDFIVDGYQLLEARLAGADAVLLIVAALDEADLAALYESAVALALTPLVEVHNEAELERALTLQPRLIGINNRDLRTFDVDLATTERLRDRVPPECVLISESGIRGAADVERLAGIQVDAVLVGEALVTAPDPARKVRELKAAGR